jgi:multidrug efflux pump
MMAALAAVLARPRTVLTLMVVMVAAGIWAYVSLPKEAAPDVQVPVFYVSIVHQGISPEDAERLLIKPMETELRGLDGIKEITSIASQGHAGIILEFKSSVDKQAAGQDVREKVDLAKAELPSGAEEPTVNEINLSLFPVMVVILSGDVPERTLYRHARRLKDEIESIPTVLEANLTGHREEVLEVVLDDLRLQSYNISQDQLIKAVTQNNQLIAAGALDTGRGRFNIKVPGLFQTARDVYNLPVKVSGDGVVTLSDVAQIRRTFKDPVRYARFNGKPAIAIEVIKRIGSNIVENNRQVRSRVTAFSRNWPSAINIGYSLDLSKRIFEVLGSLQSAIMTAITLVMIVVVAALGMRSAFMVGLAIPTSFMIGFLFVALFGLTINNMVMFGMVLTVGILVDSAIVVVEYADRKMAEGFARTKAYVMAAQRMFWPIFSSTATTLAAFFPMLFWPGVAGEFMSYLPITVIIVLTASLVTAMIFLPVLGAMFGKTADQNEAVLKQLAGEQSGDLGKLPGPSGAYIRLLQRLIPHPGKVTLGAMVVLAGAVALFTKFNNGTEFFIDTEPEQAMVLVSARGNLSALEQLRIARRVEKIILGVDGVDAVFTRTGNAGSSPKIGSGQSLDVPRDLIAQLTVDLRDFDRRRKGAIILQEMRDTTAGLPGIKVEVRKREEGPPTGKDVRLQIRADTKEQAIAAVSRVRRHFDTGVKGLIDIEDGRPLPGIEWLIKVDRKEAGRFGADIAQVGALVQMVTNGILIGTYRPDDSQDEIDIRVRFPTNQRSVDRLDQLRLTTPKGLVPIANFTSRIPKPAVDTITRKDGRVSIDVKANVKRGLLADDKVREIQAWLDKQKWPDGVQFKFRGADEEQRDSGAFLTKALLAALFLMFIILVTQFNSFYHTVLTLSTVIMSVIGVLIGMMITGQTFSVIMTGTGIVALAGIVVNNSIVLIDTYKRLMETGMDLMDAVLRTAAQRLRPVILTTVTTICGLLPMALQFNVDFFARSISFGGVTSVWWVQLSTAIIFGLSFATVLTLVLTPVLLAAPETYRKAWRQRHSVAPRVKPAE